MKGSPVRVRASAFLGLQVFHSRTALGTGAHPCQRAHHAHTSSGDGSTFVAALELDLADQASAVRARARASAIACSIGTRRRFAASAKTWPYTRAVKPGSAWPMCAATSVTG